MRFLNCYVIGYPPDSSKRQYYITNCLTYQEAFNRRLHAIQDGWTGVMVGIAE